jgi:HD-GYP domain-containing protein (c-di-GMP phosphodiesterase class II)
VAVYLAKQHGRNRVALAREVPPEVQSMVAQAGECLAAPGETSPEPLPASAPEPQQAGQPEPQPLPAPAPGPEPSALFRMFISSVVALGVGAVLLGAFLGARPEPLIIVVLVVLAILAERLEVNVYGTNTVSVSVAASFAAASTSGMLGVALVSLAIVLVHAVQKRPALYKTAFNWATHALAGMTTVVIFQVLGIVPSVADLPLLLASTFVSALVYFLVDTGLISIAISLVKRAPVAAVWNTQFRWLAGHYLVLCVLGLALAVAYTISGVLGMLIFMLPIMMMHFSQRQYVEKTAESIKQLQDLNEQLVQANREVVAANAAIRQFNAELFLTLAKILDARDPYVRGHSTQVATYATAIGIDLGLEAEQLERLRQAALLHDIGKLGIPEHILNKPARLTEAEYQLVKTHAALGGDFLETSQGLRPLAPMVRHHHERWDGRGYPEGLRGEQIPLEARIIAVCDAVEAMVSDRPYQPGMPLPQVIAEVRRCAGTHFDPAIAEIFVRIMEAEGERLVVNSAHSVLQRDDKHHLFGAALPGVLVPSYAARP